MFLLFVCTCQLSHILAKETLFCWHFGVVAIYSKTSTMFSSVLFPELCYFLNSSVFHILWYHPLLLLLI